MGHGHAVQEGFREPARALRRASPEVHDGCREVHAAGALGEKTRDSSRSPSRSAKECDGSIASHARGAVRTAAESEVAEALGVAIGMIGRPATGYGPCAFAAFRDSSGQTDIEQG